MSVLLTQESLWRIFEEQEFTGDQQAFFVAALRNDHPTIAHKYFAGNVDIDSAIYADEQCDVIGPPMGLSEYLAPLHAMLAAKSPDPARTEKMLSDSFGSTPSTK
ncbi:MAG: hypothetical protein ACPGRX_01190, partial [Bdellovibrionales bacterium]